MSILIEKEEMDMGLALIHDRLVGAVKAYEDFLITFGTCPDMTLVEELKVLTDKVLTHDGANVVPFRRTAMEETK
jgi:hypothetical protein